MHYPRVVCYAKRMFYRNLQTISPLKIALAPTAEEQHDFQFLFEEEGLPTKKRTKVEGQLEADRTASPPFLPLPDREALAYITDVVFDFPGHGLDDTRFAQLAGNNGVSEWARRLPPVGDSVSAVGEGEGPAGQQVVLTSRVGGGGLFSSGGPRLLEDQSFPLFRFVTADGPSSAPKNAAAVRPPTDSPKFFDLFVSTDTPIAKLSPKLTSNPSSKQPITLNWLIPAVKCPRFVMTRGDVDSHNQTHHTFALSVFGFNTANVFAEWLSAGMDSGRWGSFGHHAPILAGGELTLSPVEKGADGVWRLVDGDSAGGSRVVTGAVIRVRMRGSSQQEVGALFPSSHEAVADTGTDGATAAPASFSPEFSYYTITDVNNKSGHYRPTGGEMFNVLLPMLVGEFGEAVADLLFGAATLSVAKSGLEAPVLGALAGAAEGEESPWAEFSFETAKRSSAVAGTDGKARIVVAEDGAAVARGVVCDVTSAIEGDLEEVVLEGGGAAELRVLVPKALADYHNTEIAAAKTPGVAPPALFKLNGKPFVVPSSSSSSTTPPSNPDPRTAAAAVSSSSSSGMWESDRQTQLLHGGLARVFLRAENFQPYIHEDVVAAFYGTAGLELEAMFDEAQLEAARLLSDFHEGGLRERLREALGGARGVMRGGGGFFGLASADGDPFPRDLGNLGSPPQTQSSASSGLKRDLRDLGSPPQTQNSASSGFVLPPPPFGGRADANNFLRRSRGEFLASPSPSGLHYELESPQGALPAAPPLPPLGNSSPSAASPAPFSWPEIPEFFLTSMSSPAVDSIGQPSLESAGMFGVDSIAQPSLESAGSGVQVGIQGRGQEQVGAQEHVGGQEQVGAQEQVGQEQGALDLLFSDLLGEDVGRPSSSGTQEGEAQEDAVEERDGQDARSGTRRRDLDDFRKRLLRTG